MVMRILIVDDEPIERKAIRKCLIDHGFDEFEFAEAGNGRNAIIRAEEFRPDIIFMDIQMPGINGIEAAKEIQSQNAGTRFIIVSAYDTFDYARQAMKIGIQDYLLKPSTDEEMIETLEKVIHSIHSEKSKRNEEITLKDKYNRALSVIETKVISSILMGDRVIESENHLPRHYADTLNRPSFVMIVKCKCKDDKIFGDTELTSTFSYIYTQLERIFPKVHRGLLVKQGLPLLVHVNSDDIRSGVYEKVYRYLNEMVEKCKEQFPHPLIHVGVGKVYDHVDSFASSYQEALFALSAVQEEGKEVLLYHELINRTPSNASYPYQLENKLIEIISAGLKDEVEYQYKKFFYVLSHSCQHSFQKVYKKLNEFFIVLHREVNKTIPTIEMDVNQIQAESLIELQEKVGQLLCQLTKTIYDIHYSNQFDGIELAKKYIEIHYEDQLTLEEISDVVQLSPHYFSKIFKMKTNRSFVEYLTDIRIKKAKELLRNPEANIKEICFSVGYKDPNYFSRVFKKMTGYSPSEYKDYELMKLKKIL